MISSGSPLNVLHFSSSIVHTILYTANTPVSYYTLAWVLCMYLHATMLEYNLTSYTDARTSVTYSCYIIGYPWPTYIRWRVIYYLPLTQSLKNCISIAGLIQYAALALAADAHACTLQKGKKKACHFPVSNL